MKIFGLIILCMLSSCAPKAFQPDVTSDVCERTDMQSSVDKANAAARQVLREFNYSDASKKLSGPFTLSDYELTVSASDDCGNNPVVKVSYELNKPVSFRGHPQHFDVWVFKKTGETKVFKGR